MVETSRLRSWRPTHKSCIHTVQNYSLQNTHGDFLTETFILNRSVGGFRTSMVSSQVKMFGRVTRVCIAVLCIIVRLRDGSGSGSYGVLSSGVGKALTERCACMEASGCERLQGHHLRSAGSQVVLKADSLINSLAHHYYQSRLQ